MNEDQAIAMLTGVCSDYVNDIKRQGHESAAKALAATCNVALAKLKDGRSSAQPPGSVNAQDPD